MKRERKVGEGKRSEKKRERGVGETQKERKEG